MFLQPSQTQFIEQFNNARLFDVDIKEELFDESIPSLGPKGRCSPAYLCGAGILKMAQEFKQFPEQYEANLKYLKDAKNEFHTGAALLEKIYNSLD